MEPAPHIDNSWYLATPAQVQAQRAQPGSEEERFQIIDRFTYHTPTDEQRERLNGLALAIRGFVETYLDLVPQPSAFRSRALTQLEMARMFLNASIIFSDPPEPVDPNPPGIAPDIPLITTHLYIKGQYPGCCFYPDGIRCGHGRLDHANV